MICSIIYALEKTRECISGDCYTAAMSEKKHLLKLHILIASGSLKFSDVKL